MTNPTTKIDASANKIIPATTCQIDICSFNHLDQIDYILIGNSAWLSTSLNQLIEKGINLPLQVIDIDEKDKRSEQYFSPNTIPLKHRHFVIASDIDQIKIANAFTDVGSRQFWDLSPALMNNFEFYHSPPKPPYLIVFCVNPVDQHPMWIESFMHWLEPLGYQLIYRHPLQALDTELLQNSEGVLLWNGTLDCFNIVKRHLSTESIPYSFFECGFFPQTHHMYFDRYGINVDSALAMDDLTWLPDDYQCFLTDQSEQFFSNIQAYTEHSDYIFVPLQLGHDSNIQQNSRFTRGMQEFVDYIELTYPNQTIVFKAHPRDKNSYVSRSATSFWSEASSLSLIKSATKVHGINSTVLFEAALFGVETIIEGDCLLSRHCGQHDKILAAILYRQFNVKRANYSAESINDLSYLNLPSQAQQLR